MEVVELDCNAILWDRCKKRLIETRAQTPETLVVAVEGLLPEWCIDGEGMHQILEHATGRGELPQEVLSLWTARLSQLREEVAASAPAHAFVDESLSAVVAEHVGMRMPLPAHVEDTVPGSLPAPLWPFARAIGECSRKQGRAALQLGRQLCSARDACLRNQLSFRDFLGYLRQHFGLNRGTCYLYMKYCEWNFPDGLGSAVMKWIAQGFIQGTPEATQVIHAASEGLTLAQLTQRFGSVRDRQQEQQTQKAASNERTPRMIKRLEKDRQRLLERRLDIDTRLKSLESRLLQLRSRTH